MAVFVGVVVALTGARHSSGGGCDSSSNSSSSSSGSGGNYGGSTHYDDDDDYDTGSSSGGGAQSTGPSAEETTDVKIDKCAYDPAEGLVARVSATNSSAITTYSYTFDVIFKDSTGKELDTGTGGILTVDAGATESTDVVARQSASGSGSGTCELSNALRMSDSY
ncbi:hypothetical protein [Streptomyces sp. NBC_01092]|uniref:hypothetical protein n=1 Tax=Streptomyces sp. NBC_01092 TaxID=2903748 RepID=UPI003866864A|nr:hypothetical protein OG254_21570 [Streptomyces sp. NBC_01092]